MTLVANALANVRLKTFPFGGQRVTTGLLPGAGILPLVGGISQSYGPVDAIDRYVRISENRAGHAAPPRR